MRVFLLSIGAKFGTSVMEITSICMFGAGGKKEEIGQLRGKESNIFASTSTYPL